MSMDTLSRIIHDVSTGEIREEILSEEETSQIKIKEAEFLAKLEQLENEKATKAIQRQALLERLGITEEEAKLLLS
jgi:hypothetical protein